MKYSAVIATLSGWSAVSLAADLALPRMASTSIISSANICFSSPLLAAQEAITARHQCAPKKRTHTANSNSTTTTMTKPSATETEAVTSSSDGEGDPSSGGWTGPYGCTGSYCVYAHATFATGRGIVLISDGAGANALANLPIVVELATANSAWAAIADAKINTQTHGVVTKIIPGKGRGFVATRSIHRGEQVMAYTPALIIQRSFFDEESRKEQLRLLRDAVSRLPQATRVAFWKQLGQTHEAGDDDILDVIMNNSFNLPLTGGVGGPFIGNFPEVSMYNHDCRPSVAFHLDGGVIHRTQAVKSGGIAKGEELSISYVDSFRVRSVRRARTKRNWGFECACALCGLPEALANASDHRLWRIYEVENALAMRPGGSGGDGGGGGGGGGSSSSTVDTADRIELLLSLYAQERLLESHGASVYQTAAENYNGLKRRELAIKYALLALEAYVLEAGARSGGVGEMVALLEDPEGHWSWGRRL